MSIEKNNQALPEKWITCKLKDVGEIIAGGTPSTNEPSFWGDEISWITPADLSGYKSMFISKGRKSISIKGLQSSSARLIPKGSVLFSSRAPIGYVVIASNELATNQGFKNIVPYSGIDSKYLYYYLLGNKQLAEENASGTTFKEISATKFAELPLVLAPSNEQVRISDKLDELLSELEKGKEQLQTSLEQLKVYRQSILKHAFEGKLFNVAKKDWTIGKLKDYCEITSSKRIFQNEYVSNGIPFYRTKEIKELSQGKEITIELYISQEKYQEIKNNFQVPTKGDVLLSAVGTIGISYVIPDEKPFYFKDGNLLWLRNFKGLNPNYLSYALTHFVKNENEVTISGTAYNALTIVKLKELEIPIPSLAIQEKIVELVDQQISHSKNLEQTIISNLVNSETVKTALLQKAFEGKLVEQDPKDEPASVLLERIKKEREEYLKAEKEKKKSEKPLYIKTRKMAEELKRIIEILKESKEPVSAKTLWQSSTHKDDIDDFYAALKKHIEAGEIIEVLPRKGKESLLKLADAK